MSQTQPLATSESPVVVFDGACPLCRREIAHYRRRAGAEGLRWVDAVAQVDQLAELGLDQATALARLHVRDAEGQWQTGAAGFVYLWSCLRPYLWLARLVRALRMLPLLEWGYGHFLRWRSRRNCNAQTCGRR